MGNAASIWWYQMSEFDLQRFTEVARLDTFYVYETGKSNSAPLLLEYDAVVMRVLKPPKNDSERKRQILRFLSDESKIFVFLLDQFNPEPPNNLDLVNHVFEDIDVMAQIRPPKSGRNITLTPAATVSSFREYLEHEHLEWHIAFRCGQWMTPLALDSEGDAVAFSLTKYANRAYFLPTPSGGDHIKLLLENVLEAITRSAISKDPAPSWTNKFSLPGMRSLQKEIETLHAEISLLESKTASSQSKLDDYAIVRDSLLSSDGTKLEKAVTKVFDVMGYKPITGPKGQHDIIFRVNEMQFLAEIKGATSSASEGHIKQLHAKRTQYIERNQIEPKGILIINAYRQYEPAEREADGRRIFPDSIMNLVRIWRFCLMTTTQLFQIYSLHLDGDLDSATLASKIYDTVGPLTGYELQD